MRGRGPDNDWYMTQSYLTASSLQKLFNITEEDFEKIRKFGKFAKPKIGLFIDRYHTWLRETVPDIYEELFSDKQVLEDTKKLMKAHWELFWDAKIDQEFIKTRTLVTKAHATQLEPSLFIAVMSQISNIWLQELYEGEMSEEEYRSTVKAIQKLMNLDCASSIKAVEEVLAEQCRALIEMSAPISELWCRVLMLPLIGVIDSKRAEDIMETLLAKITKTQALVVILDISGVGIVDTAVANHLIKMTKAAELMGCTTIISGLSPHVAQTIVSLGIDVGAIHTTNALQDALRFAFKVVESECPSGTCPKIL